MLFIRRLSMASSRGAVPLRKKFRGSMLGALLGDCLGAPYEGNVVSAGDRIIIQRYFDKLEDPTFKCPFKKYTDDTAMTKAVAKFLIDKPEPDYRFLAKLFVTEFYNEPNRGYGQGVVDVFEKLRNNKLSDIYKPAAEQFHGSGSYGNGGAMRIAPIALFFHGRLEQALEVARNATKITHTNTLGVNGALLQCAAIQEALREGPEHKLSPREFLSRLTRALHEIERSTRQENPDFPEESEDLKIRLKMLHNLLKKPLDDDLDEEVITYLGNNVTAHESVPTAIYCFLRAMDEIPTVQTDNIFRRAVQYAITLGGDTDTIASMTGAICGAYFGEDIINRNLLKHCEKYEEIIELADNLYEAQKLDSESDEAELI